MYEKLQFEENSQLQHKSQWNPRKGITVKTPKGKSIKPEKAESSTEKTEEKTEDKAEDNAEEKTEKPAEEQEPAQDGEQKKTKEKKVSKTPKVKKEPKTEKKPEKETPAGMRKSGRTPKPKKMHGKCLGF